MDSGINIIDLNLDVQDIIFSKLKMVDQINFGCAHPNLREGFLFHNRRKLKTIYLQDFEVSMWDTLLSLCGYMVESLVLGSDYLLLGLNCAAKHCKSLQEIDFTIDLMLNRDELGYRLSELRSLNYIWIINYSLEIYNIELDRIIESMQALPNLRKLRLRRFPEEALIQLRELTQLEELYIEWREYYSYDIGYICATLKNLRVLIFIGKIKDADSFHDLPQFCPLLEKLTLNSTSSTQIPYFPKLKELDIEFYFDPIEQRLGECGYRYAKQLDKLTIRRYEPIKNSELLEQLRGIKDFQIIIN